jgi:hypothetical protein
MADFFVRLETTPMKHCRSCHSAMRGESAHASIPRLERLLKRHGVVPRMIESVAVSLGPMCEKCLKDWAKELSSN